jgi:hypothetical protein
MKRLNEEDKIYMNGGEFKSLPSPRKFLSLIISYFMPFTKYSPPDAVKDNCLNAYRSSRDYAMLLAQQKEYYVGKKIRTNALKFIKYSNKLIVDLTINNRLSTKDILIRLKEDLLNGEGFKLNDRGKEVGFPILLPKNEPVPGLDDIPLKSKKSRRSLLCLPQKRTGRV